MSLSVELPYGFVTLRELKTFAQVVSDLQINQDICSQFVACNGTEALQLEM